MIQHTELIAKLIALSEMLDEYEAGGFKWSEEAATARDAADALQALERQKQPDDLEQIIDAFVEDYEMVGEDEDGRDACHTPTEGERALIKDAICGLLADPDWDNAWGDLIRYQAQQRTEERVPMTWQSIDTAPKDGTNVLLYFSGLGWVRGSWDSQTHHRKPKPYWTHDCIQYMGVAHARANQPSWWQRLPPTPPESKG